jgi:hypothetical protein
MYHFYSLMETNSPQRKLQVIGGTNITESYLILDHTGSYPNLRSYAQGFSDQRYSFVAV